MRLDSKLPNVGTTIFTVMSQLAGKYGAVNLGQGFPDFEGPELLREALAEAMASGKNQYAPMIGVAPLREQMAQKIARDYGAQVDPDTDITVTSGGTEALFAAIACAVGPGDEVIVLDPCYDSYDPAIALQGARAVHVPLLPPDFAADWDRVKAAVTARTRMIVVNSPHNPTGAVLSAADLDALAALLRGSDILLLSDEVYEHMVFDGAVHQSVLRHPELASRAFVVGSFGKTYHCTGWKVGTCVAPPALSAELRKVHQYLTFCTFHPAQWALADVMARHPEHASTLPAFYQAKRDHFRALLRDTPFELLPVKGAYFQVADYSALGNLGDLAFCEWLVAHAGVAAIPLSAFYADPPRDQRLVRFCFAKTEATLEAAAARLGSL